MNPALAPVLKASAIKIKAIAATAGHTVAHGALAVGHGCMVTTSLGLKALVIVGTGYYCYILIDQISTVSLTTIC